MRLLLKISLFLTSECFAQLLVPLGLLICTLGLLGWCGQHLVSQLLDVAPIEKWPIVARFAYRIMYYN